MEFTIKPPSPHFLWGLMEHGDSYEEMSLPSVWILYIFTLFEYFITFLGSKNEVNSNQFIGWKTDETYFLSIQCKFWKSSSTKV